MKEFNFKCDMCGKKGQAFYNGEHYLPPANWTELRDVKLVVTIGHLCGSCNPINKKKKGKK